MKRKYFISDNLKLSYLDNEQTEKSVIICMHGHFGNARYYSNILESKNYRVFSLDLRGHGFSEHSKEGNYRIIDFVNDFSAFMDNLIKNEKINNKITVIGHSLGGLIAYYAASVHSDITKIIIEDIGNTFTLGWIIILISFPYNIFVLVISYYFITQFKRN